MELEWRQDKERVNLFLIDGFPRNADNLEGWDKIVGDSVPPPEGCFKFWFDSSSGLVHVLVWFRY